jgi:hypothetical protein
MINGLDQVGLGGLILSINTPNFRWFEVRLFTHSRNSSVLHLLSVVVWLVFALCLSCNLFATI